MPGVVDPNASYSPTIGLLYVFNLIVGTGALAFPKAFQSAGFVLSVLVLLISCFISYVSASFVIESLAVANAVNAKNKKDDDADGEESAVIGPSSFEITQRVEVSEMASMFLGKAGVVFSYIVLNVYLFGDLAIYSTTVPKSMMNILCSAINTSTVLPTDLCHHDLPSIFTRFAVYRICVILFIIICTPMVMIGITKTKYLQLATTISRWTAFSLMICLAIYQLFATGAQGHPPAVNVHGFGSLFGVTVYAFMCHHSIPGLITPMTSKVGIFVKLACVYAVVIMFYFTLSITGAFAFSHVQDVYTLNFLHDEYTSVFYFVCDHFLALFPVFTLSTNYPIVATTLINNVKVLKQMIVPFSSSDNQEVESLITDDIEPPRPRARSIRSDSMTGVDLFIVGIVLGLPTLISLFTDNVLLLATITGSYPGVGVQFLIPCMLVLAARRQAKSFLSFPVPRTRASPFQSPFWVLAIFVWSCFAIIMVTLNVTGVQF